MEINKRVSAIVEEFKQLDSWEEKYKQLIEMGRNFSEMTPSRKIDKFLVKGCQSKVWFFAWVEEGKVYFQGDSDASIVKGIVALLLTVYSGSTPDEILATKPTFLEEIGLREHLSMSRSNGLSAMLKQLSLYAIAFKSQI